MAYDIAGKVKLIQEAQTFSSGFTKRELVVLTDDGKYPQEINIEFLQDSVSKLDNVSEGDLVKVTFDLRGKEYNGRYFNNLVGWKIEVEGKAAETEDRPPLPPDEATGSADSDDIPF